jgi:hypothetical protein
MSSDPSDRAALEREIRSRQEHLASTVDELAGRVAPKALVHSATAGAKSRLARLVDTARSKVGGGSSDRGQLGAAPYDDHGSVRARPSVAAVRMAVGPAVVDEDGALRVARITAVGSAVLALVGALLWRRGSR